MELIVDLLLPETDKAVLFQLVLVVVAVGLVLWRFWSKTELRLVVVGAGMVLLGLMGVRALH